MKFNSLLPSSLSVILIYAAVFPPSSTTQQLDQPPYSFSARAEDAIRAQSGACCIEPLNPGDIVAGLLPAPAGANGCLLGDTQYKIDFPGGARKLVIDLTVSQSVTVYIRRGSPIAIEDGQIRADFSDFRFISSTRVERFSFPSPGRMSNFEPGIPLLQSGSYFIGVSNCGKEATSYTMSAKILDPPDAETINLSGEPVQVGSVPAPEPGFCRIGRSQYLRSTFFTPCGGATLATVIVRADQNVNLYFRKGQPVTEENGIVMYDGLTTSQGKLQLIFVASGTPGTTDFFIAIENCGFATVNYTITSVLITGDPVPVIIESVFFKKKDLYIVGFSLRGATVFIDDQPQQGTEGGRDSNFRDIIIIKKAKKMIARGQTVRITIGRNGCSSVPFVFTRP